MCRRLLTRIRCNFPSVFAFARCGGVGFAHFCDRGASRHGAAVMRSGCTPAMGDSRSTFIMRVAGKRWRILRNVHRTILSAICSCLPALQGFTPHHSLESCLPVTTECWADCNELSVLLQTRIGGFGFTKSPCQRNVNLMLRWLVRNDGIVDLGVVAHPPTRTYHFARCACGRISRELWTDIPRTERLKNGIDHHGSPQRNFVRTTRESTTLPCFFYGSRAVWSCLVSPLTPKSSYKLSFLGGGLVCNPFRRGFQADERPCFGGSVSLPTVKRLSAGNETLLQVIQCQGNAPVSNRGADTSMKEAVSLVSGTK